MLSNRIESDTWSDMQFVTMLTNHYNLYIFIVSKVELSLPLHWCALHISISINDFLDFHRDIDTLMIEFHHRPISRHLILHTFLWIPFPTSKIKWNLSANSECIHTIHSQRRKSVEYLMKECIEFSI